MDQKARTRKNDDIEEFGNGNALWDYDTGLIKAYTEDYATKAQLEKVGKAKLCCIYTLPKKWVISNGPGRVRRKAWDFVIPISRKKTVVKILRGNFKNYFKGEEKNGTYSEEKN